MSNLKARSNARKSSKVTTIRKAKPTTVTVRRDVMQEVTNSLIAQLETCGAWERPWIAKKGDAVATGLPVNVASGRAYRGINVMLLWSAGRGSNIWGTYKQWMDIGCQVRKGERSTGIIFWKKLTITDGEAEGDDETKEIMMARNYAVFAADQVDGYEPKPVAPIEFGETVAHLDAWFANTKLDIRHGGDSAYYSRNLDYIQVPFPSRFRDTAGGTALEGYYGTLAHEAIHATGSPTRLDREKGKAFGDETYAKEELVAEMGSAFLCALLGVSATVRQDHAAYLKNWLSALRDDKRFLFSAASHAQRAVDFLMALQPGSDHPGNGEDHDDESTPVEPEPATVSPLPSQAGPSGQPDPIKESTPEPVPVAITGKLDWLDTIVATMPKPGLCGPARKSRKPKREHAMFPAPVVESRFPCGTVFRFSVFVNEKLPRVDAIAAALIRGRAIARTVYLRDFGRDVPDADCRIVVGRNGSTALVDSLPKPRIRVAAVSRQLELV